MRENAQITSTQQRSKPYFRTRRRFWLAALFDGRPNASLQWIWLSSGGRDQRRPVEDEDEHRRLEERADEAHGEHGLFPGSNYGVRVKFKFVKKLEKFTKVFSKFSVNYSLADTCSRFVRIPARTGCSARIAWAWLKPDLARDAGLASRIRNKQWLLTIPSTFCQWLMILNTLQHVIETSTIFQKKTK